MNNTENTKPVSIKIQGLKKRYRLGQIGYGTLKKSLQSWWAQKNDREDPNGVIGKERISNNNLMALNGVDLTIHRGERIGIIGKNGAGKSTLLKLICQITAPTEGQIELWGRITSMLEVGVGFNSEMTGRENIYQSGAILGMTTAEIDDKIESIIEFSELRDFIDTPIKRYSSGMYVKLGFAVASHLDSEIVIMDEVLAVGDMAFQNKCISKMKSLADEGDRTILYVSHNMPTIRNFCNRVIVLDKGQISFDGDTETAIEKYLNLQSSSSQTFFDFSTVSSGRHNIESLKGKLMSLEILSKDIQNYNQGEKIKFRISVNARQAFDNMRLRLIIGANDQLIGAIPDILLGEFKKGQTRDFIITADTSLLTHGSYDMNVILCETNELGISINFDIIRTAFRFFINQSDSIVWNTAGWGHIHFPDIEIESL